MWLFARLLSVTSIVITAITSPPCSCADQLREIFGHSETLYACNTYQFSDYSRYAMTVFKEEDKRKHRDEHFPQDLQNAYELGKRLVINYLERKSQS